MRGNRCSYTASTEGSTFDTVLAVYFTSGGCESLFCHSDNIGSTSKLSWRATTGVDYYLLVAGLGDDTGTYNLTVMVGQAEYVNSICEDIFS